MASRCKRGGADVGIVVVVSRSVLVMHKACFFFQNVYSPTLSGTTRVL